MTASGALQLLLIALPAIGSAACARSQSGLPASAGHQPLDPAWGAVLPDSAAAAMIRDAAPLDPAESWKRLWTPDRMHLDRLEAQLPAVLSRTFERVILEHRVVPVPAAAYYRQYAGFQDTLRQRFIYVRGVHHRVADIFEDTFAQQRAETPGLDAMLPPGPRWRWSYYSITHGGIHIFGVVYDVERDTFDPVVFANRWAGRVLMRTP